MACTTSSSCKARERLATANLHLRSQILNRAQLQLLNRSFRLPQPLRNLPDTSLLHKSFEYHLLLNLWQQPHQPEQLGAMLDGAQLGSLQIETSGRLWRIVRGGELARDPLGVINDG